MTVQSFAPIRWVYSLKDFKTLFQLSNQSLNQRILEFPAAVSSFNFQMSALGHDVVSASPLYALEQDAMEAFVAQSLHALTEEQVAHLGEGGALPSVASDNMRRLRRMADIFLTDYSVGLRNGRYAFSGDEHLPFADGAFDLALCLVEPSATADLPSRIDELLRVASEFRLVMQLAPDVSPLWLHEVLHQLQQAQCQVAFKPVSSPQGGQHWVMLQVTRLACLVAAA